MLVRIIHKKDRDILSVFFCHLAFPHQIKTLHAAYI